MWLSRFQPPIHAESQLVCTLHDAEAGAGRSCWEVGSKVQNHVFASHRSRATYGATAPGEVHPIGFQLAYEVEY
jgi:hypothetical protein